MAALIMNPSFLLGLAPSPPPLQQRIQERLQYIAEQKAAAYNCSVSIGYKSRTHTAAAAAGTIDFGTGRKASVDDAYAWGSGTKPLTGASILKLIADGHFGLETPVAQLLDPILKHMAEDGELHHWGPFSSSR